MAPLGPADLLPALLSLQLQAADLAQALQGMSAAQVSVESKYGPGQAATAGGPRPSLHFHSPIRPTTFQVSWLVSRLLVSWLVDQ